MYVHSDPYKQKLQSDHNTATNDSGLGSSKLNLVIVTGRWGLKFIFQLQSGLDINLF